MAGDGTRAFLLKIGPIIDFILGVAFFREPTGTNAKQLGAGGAVLVGQRPAVAEECLGWMDNNMAAVRERKRERARERQGSQQPCIHRHQ
eukprot:COSAG05_NODE_1137_length_5751_cov_9.852619_3_plen_90_part_00